MSRLLALAVSLLLPLSAFSVHAADRPLAIGPHDVALGEVKIHYVVRGNGPVMIVTSPGWGIASNYLQHGLMPLEKNMTLVYVDTRGSGGSSRPGNRDHMTQADMADDLDKLRVTLGLDQIDLFGHSDGGAIALEYAERHPQQVRKLILVSPGVLGDRDRKATAAFLKLWGDDPQYRTAVAEVRRQDQLDEQGVVATDEQFQQSHGAMLPLYLGDPQRNLAALEATLKDTHLSAWAEYAEDEASAKAKRNQTQDLGRVQAHTLIINGTVDWVCPYGAAQRLAAGIHDARLDLHANKGHLPWIESTDRFFAEVNDFILK